MKIIKIKEDKPELQPHEIPEVKKNQNWYQTVESQHTQV